MHEKHVLKRAFAMPLNDPSNIDRLRQTEVSGDYGAAKR